MQTSQYVRDLVLYASSRPLAHRYTLSEGVKGDTSSYPPYQRFMRSPNMGEPKSSPGSCLQSRTGCAKVRGLIARIRRGQVSTINKIWGRSKHELGHLVLSSWKRTKVREQGRFLGFLIFLAIGCEQERGMNLPRLLLIKRVRTCGG
jgi:hypothetical protein